MKEEDTKDARETNSLRKDDLIDGESDEWFRKKKKDPGDDPKI